MTGRFIDIHVLQTVPPSNINRDDTGKPKSAVFGGVPRARVSSQAWKRATRAAYGDHLNDADLGVRTKRVVEQICGRLAKSHPELAPDEARTRAEKVIEALGLKLEKPRGKAKGGEDADDAFRGTEYLVFFSNTQIERLAALAADGDGASVDKKVAKAAAGGDHGVEVSLFGRMVADDKGLNVDASVQVAHAISTHAVELEQDYFTAVDDRNPEGQSGAGMLGTIEFNSATLYRYATVNVAGLRDNLGDDAATVRAVQAFVRAFIRSMPTGKQNTFANRTVPDAVVVIVREDQPVNLVGAFEDPVVANGEGLIEQSAARLAAEVASVRDFVSAPVASLVVARQRAAALAGVGEKVSLDGLVERLDGLVLVPTEPLPA
ncbi:type I-E CRISPR-associated protein Cas7/Cse4/CasC [Luteipulveratus mongoliensis]|uniref:CRISPR-associated protein CasC n=1 Tax=Luteipulveratus mongoliensis TaxID=571913 RepID=A0A0K1JEJ9_9MICO|nr:type I-E CRISPR-associated protein Cas7/Cse4/CasC [Luteipulveratus mongoliensis]AKU15131.1 CRISPR-associated protein CasC [Luteipulveratus mongoliensis]